MMVRNQHSSQGDKQGGALGEFKKLSVIFVVTVAYWQGVNSEKKGIVSRRRAGRFEFRVREGLGAVWGCGGLVFGGRGPAEEVEDRRSLYFIAITSKF